MSRDIEMPEEAQLDRVTILTDNSIRVDLRFLDEMWLSIDFAPGSELTQRLLSLINDAVNELVKDAFVHEQPRPGAAALTMIEEDSTRRAFRGDVKIGVPQDDVRRLAAEFKRDLLQIVGGGLHDELADLG